MMKKKMISLLFVFVIIIGAFPITANAASFSDVSNHWALQYINWAADNGYVNGYPDGTFKPEGNMTRAEFVKILNRFACAKEKADIRFDDVNTSDWYYDEVRIAVRHGYVTNGGSFRGNDAITRDDVMRMLAYVYKLTGDTTLVDKFTDGKDVISKSAVSALVNKGVVNGYPDGTIRPLRSIKRAEIAKLFHVARTILGAPELCKGQPYYPIWGGGTGTGGTWKPTPNPNPYNCPTDAALRSAFSSAVGTALGNFKGLDNIAKIDYNINTRISTVTILDNEASAGAIANTGAMVELKKLVDEKGLISYQIGSKPTRNLVGATVQQMKEWIVEDFGAALDLTSVKLGDLIGKSVSATVRFRSTRSECPRIVSDLYKVNFVGKAVVCPTEAQLKTNFAAAVGNALNAIEVDPDIAKFEYSEAGRSAVVQIVNPDATIGDIANTGAMTELKKLVDEQGLISYQIPGQPLRTLTGATVQDMKEWIVNDFGAALEIEDNNLTSLEGKSLEAEVKFKSPKAECPAIATDTYKVSFYGNVCEVPTIAKDNFAEAVGTAIAAFKIDKEIATQTYDAEARKAVVTVVDPAQSFEKLSGTGAMEQLQKLVNEKGLISYQIEGQDLRTLTGATAQQLKEWIVEDFGAALEIEDFALGQLVGKSLSAEVVFKQAEQCPELKDTYTVEFTGETLECPTEDQLKETFETAAKAAMNKVTLPADKATWAYDNKAITVTIKDKEASATDLKRTNIIVQIKDLVDNHGLLSYKVGSQKERNLVGASDTDIKGFILEDVGAALELTGEIKLGDLVGKNLSATFKFKSTKAGCNVETTDVYTATFVDGTTTVDPDPDQEVTARIVSKETLVGVTNYDIELTNATYDDITEVKVGERVLPSEDIKPIEGKPNQFSINDGTTDPTITIKAKGQTVTITQP